MGRFGRWAGVGVLAVGLAGGAASGLAGPGPVPPMDPPDPLPARVAEPAPAPADAPKPVPAAAVALVWTTPAEVRVNRPAPYTLTVTNTGPEPVQQVVVQVRVPAGVTASDAKPAAKATGGALLWELGTLAAGEAKPLAMSFTSPTKGGLTADAWVTCTGSAATTVQVREPKLEATVELPEAVELGETFEIRYRVTNAGDCDVPYDVGIAAPRELPLAWNLTPKFEEPPKPGETRFGSVAYRAAVPGVFIYRITAHGIEVGPEGVKEVAGLSASATGTVRVVAPKLAVSVSGPAEVGVGRAGTYRVTVSNTGDATARGVRPTLAPAPALVRIDRDVPEVFDLKPGEKREFAMTGDLTTAGVVLTKVSAAAGNAAVVTAECRTVVRGVPGIRMEVVDSADPLKVGEETTYEVRVQNTGTEADRNLVLACELPPGMTLVKADGPVPHLERVGVDFDLERPVKTRHTVTFDPVRELGPKTEAVFRVTVKAEKTGAAKFTAALTSGHLTTPVVKEESTTVYGD